MVKITIRKPLPEEVRSESESEESEDSEEESSGSGGGRAAGTIKAADTNAMAGEGVMISNGMKHLVYDSRNFKDSFQVKTGISVIKRVLFVMPFLVYYQARPSILCVVPGSQRNKNAGSGRPVRQWQAKAQAGCNSQA